MTIVDCFEERSDRAIDMVGYLQITAWVRFRFLGAGYHSTEERILYDDEQPQED